MKNEGSKQPGPCDQTSSNQIGNPSKKGLRVLGDIVRRGIGMRGAPKRLRGLFGSDTSASARPSVDNIDGPVQDYVWSACNYTIPATPAQDGRYRYSPLVSSQYPNTIRLVRIEPGEGIQGIRYSIKRILLSSRREGNWLLLAIAWPLFDYCDTLTVQYWHE